MPYYRSNLIVLWLTTFLASASWTQVVPFLPLYLEELGVKENLAQWSGAVFSVQFAAGILMAPIWGKIADQKGRKLMTVRAGLCLSAIYFLTGAATAPWHVLVLRFLNGALTGFIPSSLSLVATNTPKHLAARYVAFMQIASAAGSVAGPVIGGILATLVGIRGALHLSGANVLFSVILVILIVKEPNKVTSSSRSTLLEDFSTALHSPVLMRVIWITTLAMIGTVSIQPILAVYIGQLAESPERATTISGIIFALPGLALMLTANLWVRQGQRRGYGNVVQAALLGAGVLGVGLALAGSLTLFALLFPPGRLPSWSASSLVGHHRRGSRRGVSRPGFRDATSGQHDRGLVGAAHRRPRQFEVGDPRSLLGDRLALGGRRGLFAAAGAGHDSQQRSECRWPRTRDILVKNFKPSSPMTSPNM